MLIINVLCDSCGEVEVKLKDLSLWVDLEAGGAFFSFACPYCRTLHRYEATEEVVDILLDHGVTPRVWTWPAELDEHPAGPPLTSKDLLDFHDLLQQPDWFQRLLATTRRRD